MKRVTAGGRSFMKMMILDYAVQMELPPAFLKHLQRSKDGRFVKRVGCLSEGEYQLRVCGSGGRYCWIVEAEKDKNSLYFRKGWPEFLEDNNILFADVLVFKYEGWNKFFVIIFDPSGVKRNMDSKENDLILEASNVGNGVGDDEPMSMDLKDDDEESDEKPLIMDFDEPLIYYVNGVGECHMEIGRRHEKEKLRSMEPDKEDSLDCVEVEEEKEKEIHDNAAAMQKGYMELDVSAMTKDIDLDAARHSQKEKLPRFEEKIERRDFDAQKQKESLDLDFSARKGKSMEAIGGQSHKESVSSVEEGKERVKESSAIPPFSPSNTHFTATWQPTWQHYLTIPKEIAIEKDLHSKSQLVIRDLKGRIWFMKLSTREDGAINLTDDWIKFYKGFGLKQGDTCTFEFFLGRIVHIHISSSTSKSRTGQ